MKRNLLSIRRIILILLMCFMSSSIMAQKVNLDTLDIDQLNLYKDKAVKMRNAGMILTFFSVGSAAAGLIATVKWSATTSLEDFDVLMTLIPVAIGIYVGIPTAIVGIPTWAIGGSRKAKAELHLQKFNIAPDNSMAVGLGVTIRF